MSEIYVSTDVETDGPIPGPHSMLSVASAAFLSDGTLHSTFESNLETLPQAAGDPEVMKWWEGHPDAWQACRENPGSPTQVMVDYCSWLDELPGMPVFVAYPAGFDFMFVYWYLIKFAGRSPFSRRALDMRSYAMALLRSEYSESGKANMPDDWHSDRPHTHVALDDAIGQGELFCRMLAAGRG